MKILRWIVLSCLLILAGSALIFAQDMDEKKDKLAVLWVSGDRDVAEKSCLNWSGVVSSQTW